jgi:hypothetical protein
VTLLFDKPFTEQEWHQIRTREKKTRDLYHESYQEWGVCPQNYPRKKNDSKNFHDR